jgi:hypothetical protein
MVTEYRNPEWPKHEIIYTKCMEAAAKTSHSYYRNCMIHLADAVELGTISPMEAYQALDADYFPELLTVRKSRYSHLL